MTIINIGVDKEKKKKIKDFVEKSEYKTISEFVRLSIDERLKIEELAIKREGETEIPDWIPNEKYVAFVNGAIAAVGETINEVSRIALEKFPDLPCSIKKKGKKIPIPEYVFSIFSDLKCWRYLKVEEKTFPLIQMKIGIVADFVPIRAIPDSAASLSVLNSAYSKRLKLKPLRSETIFTAAGAAELNVVKATIQIDDFTTESEFLESEIPTELPFDLLIGRNLLDLFDIYLLGKKQIICLKEA